MSDITEKEYLLLEQSEIPDAQTDVALSEKGYNKRYEMPVILQNCGQHPQTVYEFKVVMQEIKTNKFFQCKQCSNKVYSIKELKKDFRWIAYQQFNDLVNEISLMNGFIFNKIQKRALKLLPGSNSKELLQDIFSRYVKENSVNQLILNQIITSNNKIRNQKTYFWAFCLLEKVKITIPVRIINCQHIECYDLFSLIKYRQESQNTDQMIFQCKMPGCDNKLSMTRIENLFSGIFVDIDLLNCIKKANPCTYKFYFNIQKQILEEEFFIENGKKVDIMVKEYYKKFNQNKDVLDDNYFEFQRNVQEKVVLLITSDMDGKDNLQKYDTYQVQMRDPITNIIVEYPARCKKCTDLTKCMDLRILIAEFQKMKKLAPAQQFQCPLCNQQLGGKLASAQVNKIMHIDQNLLSQMFKDMSYVQNGTFNYQGEKYMLQEFQDRQKIPIQEYIQSLKDTNKTTQVSYDNLYCKVNQNKPLEFPLLIKKCNQSTVIDFSTFYEKLKQKKFNLTEGITFCKCSNCNDFPIKEIQSNIYFHEGLSKVLQELKKNNIPIQKNKTYVFDFTKMELLQSKIVIINNDKTALQNVKVQEGFTSLLNDEEYQKFFARDKIGNYAFKIKQIDSSIADGIYVTHKADGVQANLDQKVEQMNYYASKDSDLSKWGFKVMTMKVELSNEIISSNKGEIQSKFY